jgi:hypothetical protein
MEKFWAAYCSPTPPDSSDSQNHYIDQAFLKIILSTHLTAFLHRITHYSYLFTTLIRLIPCIVLT